MSNTDDKFFSTLFDLNLEKYITLRLVKTLYIIGLILIGLWWLAQVIATFTGAALITDLERDLSSAGLIDSSSTSAGEMSLGMSLLFTLFLTVYALFLVVMLRISLEVAQAFARTARAWRRIQERHEQGLVSF